MQSVNYQLIETVVRRTLMDIKDNPDRTIRNLIDMALHFAEGKFEQDFFSGARRMLDDDRSAYYALGRDIAMHVDMENLVRFGMNVGYNGCVVGAKRIRETEAAKHFNIPWSLTLMIDPKRFDKLSDRYHDVIHQANDLGIHTFLIRTNAHMQKLLPLAKAHLDSAFILFCGAEDVTEDLISEIQSMHHLMIAVRLSDKADEACARLQSAKRLYALDVPYGEEEAHGIASGELLNTAQALHPAFVLFTPKSSCPANLSERVYAGIRQAREMQQYATIPLDTVHDFSVIDSIISNEPSSACFDENGVLWTSADQSKRQTKSLFESPLSDILRNVFPKI